MRTIDVEAVAAKIREMAVKLGRDIDSDYVARIESAKSIERSPLGLRVLN